MDEADRLLDLGFESKIREIVTILDESAASSAAGKAPARRQTVLLSATLPPALGAFARQLMHPGAVAVGFSAKQLNEPEEGGGDGDGGGLEGGAAAEGEQFEIPAQLRQAFLDVPAKLRLVALVAALRARLMPRGGRAGGAGDAGESGKAKIVVFFSNCDSVEFHHELLTRCSAAGASSGCRGGPLDSEDEGEGRDGGVAGLLPLAPLKLHGDLPQAERTSNMLRFAQVRPACSLLWQGSACACRRPPCKRPTLKPPCPRSLPPPTRPRPACCSAPTSRRAASTSRLSRPSSSTTPRASPPSTSTASGARRGWGSGARL